MKAEPYSAFKRLFTCIIVWLVDVKWLHVELLSLVGLSIQQLIVQSKFALTNKVDRRRKHQQQAFEKCVFNVFL